MQRKYVLGIFCLGIGLLVFTGAANSALVSSDDLWEGVTTIEHSGDFLRWPAENMFGPDATLFKDYEPAGTNHYVIWKTEKPIYLERFNLVAYHDWGVDPHGDSRDRDYRGFSEFMLYSADSYDESDGSADWKLLFSTATANPYGGGPNYPGQNWLELEKAVQPTTAQYFKAVFVQAGDGSDYYGDSQGPRVMELDGYGEEKLTLALEHFPIFPRIIESFLHGSITARASKSGPGLLTATVEDVEGKPATDKLVIFYTETDSLLHGLLRGSRSDIYAPPGADLLDNFDHNSLIHFGWTNSRGYFFSGYSVCIWELAKRLLYNGGLIEGMVKVVVFNEKTNELGLIEREVAAEAKIKVKFDCIAKAFLVSGKVKARRAEWEGSTDREAGFEDVTDLYSFQPKDTIKIWPTASLAIAWINRNVGFASVPKRLIRIDDDGTIHYFPVVLPDTMKLKATAFHSDFKDIGDKFQQKVNGFVTDKAVGYAFGLCPGAQTVRDVCQDLSGLSDTVAEVLEEEELVGPISILKIRLRSLVLIKPAYDHTKVYCIEGSPDIRTVAGGELTIGDRKVVTISNKGQVSEIGSFDIKDLDEWEEKIRALLKWIHPQPAPLAPILPLLLDD